MELLNSLRHDITSFESSLSAVNNMINNSDCDAMSNLKMIYMSSFGRHQFYFHNKPSIKNAWLQENAGKPITYSELCKFMRTYIIQNNLLGDDGLINCDAFLKKICGKDSVSLFEFLKHVKHIIC
jgi:hypothetical protein